jgi:hypothetical protein
MRDGTLNDPEPPSSRHSACRSNLYSSVDSAFERPLCATWLYGPSWPHLAVAQTAGKSAY